MNRDVSRLSEREKQVLRLLVRGHDAKSIANDLDLSIHTINERLRDARRKLDVSSSREAARRLAAVEEPIQNSRDEKIGVGPRRAIAERVRDEPRGRLVSVNGALIVLLIALIAAGFAWSGRDAPAKQPAAGIPKVVATMPRAGSVIAPGPFLLSVTFDQPMIDGYSFVQISSATYPQCQAGPDIAVDRRTFTLRCTALPARQYEIWFNREPYMNFRSQAQVSAQPYQLIFRTLPHP